MSRARARGTRCLRQVVANAPFLTWAGERVPNLASRMLGFVESALRDLYTGIGKPEFLKDLGSDVGRRRRTQEDRYVHTLTHGRIEFLQGRYHD
ncbi:type II toxin-antitoxin system YoeB family toxin [Accumulibacter sp.]|uniref:type II toxin-antitoxin system YoeB family toxin n=1 Tax=Accumulibacter sp. TaxID=2053492 RepID=UPI00260E0307|nr:type II toxin-antitoxin system YoeB family toxin [Accumulibacter sp.]